MFTVSLSQPIFGKLVYLKSKLADLLLRWIDSHTPTNGRWENCNRKSSSMNLSISHPMKLLYLLGITIDNVRLHCVIWHRNIDVSTALICVTEMVKKRECFNFDGFWEATNSFCSEHSTEIYTKVWWQIFYLY